MIEITKDSLQNGIFQDGQLVFGVIDTMRFSKISAIDSSGSVAHGIITGIEGSITAFGKGTHAEGYARECGIINASVEGSVAIGVAAGQGEITKIGIINASAGGAFANGYADYGNIAAFGKGSHAEGHVSNNSSIIAEGDGAIARGHVSNNSSIIAEGDGAVAMGYAINSNIIASGKGSHAEGCAINSSNILAFGDGAHAEGCGTYAFGTASHAEGEGIHYIDTEIKPESISNDGTGMQLPQGDAGGFNINDIISYNNQFVKITNVNYDFDKITFTPALTDIDIEQPIDDEHILKYQSGAIGYASHVEGIKTIAFGTASHAEGIGTHAIDNGAHASGNNTIANQEAMSAIGTYNVSINTENQLFVVGNGTSDSSRCNAFVVKNDGDVLINPFNSSLLISLYDLICRVSPHLIYTSNTDDIISPNNSNALPDIISNTYGNDYGIMAFDTSCSSIGEHAFSGRFNLTSIKIPNSVNSIENYAFYNCFSLTSIVIPDSVTSIGSQVFAYCYGLTSILVDSNNQTYDSRNNCNAIIKTSSNTLISGCQSTVIPDSVSIIGSYAFSGCSSLTSIVIPDSVTRIDSYAFAACSGLTSVTIGNSVDIIGDWAFGDCSVLASIDIPDSVNSIGRQAFANCRVLASIISRKTNPQEQHLDIQVFDDVNKSTCVLYVPAGSISAYKSADQWKDFENIYAISE